MRAQGLATFAVAAVLGCGARSGLVSFDEPPPDDASTDIGDTSVVVRRDAATRDTAPPPSVCLPQIEALAAKIAPAVGSCTTLVRVGRTSGVIAGYRMICGGYGAIDEPTAAKKSQAETGVGVSDCFGSKSITGSKPDDVFVFFQPASAAACACCGEGWVAAVSARTGVTLLGGDIGFGGGRGLVFPAVFDDARELGAACGTRIPLPFVRGFDLTKMGSPTDAPPPLSGPLMESVLRTVWNTALPDALARKQYVFDAMILLYAPNAVEPTDAEWLVLVSSGWLE